MRYKAAIFDFDGTLFDTGEGITNCIAKALADMGKPALSESDLRYFVGPSLYESFEAKCGITGDEADNAIRIFREHYQFGGGVYQSYPYEGIDDMLRKLKENGMKIAVASSKPQTLVELLLEKHGLLPLFDCINAANGAEESSDKAGKVLACVSSLSCVPKECVMVGDRKFDIDAAKSAGMDSVYTLYGYGNRTEMAACEPTFCAENVKELGELLEK